MKTLGNNDHYSGKQPHEADWFDRLLWTLELITGLIGALFDHT
jgi:hypothetical protein